MPFELGLVFGAKNFGTKAQRDKSALIMVREKFVSRYLHRTPDGAPLPGGPQWLFSKFTLFRTEGLPTSAIAANRTLEECDPIDDFLIYRSFVIEFLAQLKQAGG